ncbi:hypothetical protein CPB84DRAFT_1795786 [Gymnopilus junonius]|uniref:AMP-dependent synthetase/ligase domain-containing protein n=1 Tax=Gymnopilus junonius TaxID=109634 RepID=A0A9P5THD9_GYMJU|nr:hypothetical protein CPB84DRAFT_1795786 [Gymnopilus junonius]
MALSDYLLTDDLTILLALISATVFLLNNLYKPQPLLHPILLGRQSDVGRARNPGESAVYRNYGTGLMGRVCLPSFLFILSFLLKYLQFPLRPAKDVHILSDFVRPEIETPRTLWSTKLTNSHLQDRAAAFATGLLRLGRVQPQKSNVLLLLNDCLEFIVADLALASHSINSITLSSSKLLAPVLEAHPPSAIITHAFLLPQLLELIYDSSERTTEHIIIVVGDPSSQTMASVASNVKLFKFGELEREGFKVEKVLSPAPKPTDIFTVSFYETKSGQIQGAQLTHENLTAGVAAIRALFPLANALSALDTIVSSHSISAAYGRAIVYTAIYEGTNFASIPSSELYHAEEGGIKPENAETAATRKYPIPSPTVLFLKPAHLSSIVSGILQAAKKSWFLYSFAWRHKLAGVTDGFITNQSLWDRLVFDGARAKTLGNGAATIREVIVSGGDIESEMLTPARIALSVPLVNAFTHPLVAAPVLASNPLDLQDIPSPRHKDGAIIIAHTGPPGVNVEVKLIGVDDDVVENGGDPVGDLLVRGPPVGKMVNMEDYVDVPTGIEVESENDGWMQTEVKAKVQTNGSFQLCT